METALTCIICFIAGWGLLELILLVINIKKASEEKEPGTRISKVTGIDTSGYKLGDKICITDYSSIPDILRCHEEIQKQLKH